MSYTGKTKYGGDSIGAPEEEKKFGFAPNASTANPTTITEAEMTARNNASSSTTIDPIKEGSPVVSSSDRTGEFNSISSEIQKRDVTMDGDTGVGTGKDNGNGNEQQTPPPQGDNGTNKGVNVSNDQKDTGSGDPVYDSYLANREKNEADAEKWANEQRQEYERLLPKTLALIDSQYKSTKMNIEATYSQLIDEQKRINLVGLDRRKAYGVQNGGGYMPLEFTSSISTKEKSNAREISNLNSERDGLLQAAKAARNEGRIDAMRDNLADIRQVESDMRDRIADLQKELQTRLEVTVTAREKKEKEHLEEVDKALQRAALSYLDDFEDAKDPEAVDKIIKGIIKDSGGTLSPDDYYDIYSGLSTGASDRQKAETDATKDALDIEKKRADIANVNNTIYNRNRTANRTEKETNVISDVNELFGMANEDGNPIVGDDGFANPDVWREAAREAQNDKMKRSIFLEEFGHLVNPNNAEDYGITQAERDKLKGDD
jgi:hypothetical protein